MNSWTEPLKIASLPIILLSGLPSTNYPSTWLTQLQKCCHKEHLSGWCMHQPAAVTKRRQEHLSQGITIQPQIWLSVGLPRFPALQSQSCCWTGHYRAKPLRFTTGQIASEVCGCRDTLQLFLKTWHQVYFLPQVKPGKDSTEDTQETRPTLLSDQFLEWNLQPDDPKGAHHWSSEYVLPVKNGS